MFKSTKRNTMNKAEAKLVLLNDKIPYSQRCLWNKLKRPGIYARRKSATFRCLNERGPRESRWFSTIMVYAKKIQTSYLLNEPLFTILAPSSNRLTNDNKIRKIRYTNEREREKKKRPLHSKYLLFIVYNNRLLWSYEILSDISHLSNISR